LVVHHITKDESPVIFPPQRDVSRRMPRNGGTGSAFETRKGTKKPKTRAVRPLAHVTKRNVAAGKRGSVTLLLRGDLVLPSELYKGGVPRSFLDTIMLKRAPKRKK